MKCTKCHISTFKLLWLDTNVHLSLTNPFLRYLFQMKFIQWNGICYSANFNQTNIYIFLELKLLDRDIHFSVDIDLLASLRQLANEIVKTALLLLDFNPFICIAYLFSSSINSSWMCPDADVYASCIKLQIFQNWSNSLLILGILLSVTSFKRSLL